MDFLRRLFLLALFLANDWDETEYSERLMQPLLLTTDEKTDLVAFLESLTDEGIPDALRRAPPTPYLPPD